MVIRILLVAALLVNTSCYVCVGGLAGYAGAKHGKHSEPLCKDAFANMASELAPRGEWSGTYETRCMTAKKGSIYNFKLDVTQYKDGDQLCIDYEGKGNNWKKTAGSICRNLGEAERKRLDNEKQKLANIPKTATSAKGSLRKQPKTILSEEPVRAMLKKHDFFDSAWNPNGSFDSDFIDNDDGTLTDKATGLMWQKDGSPKPLTLKRATYYISKLNHKRFLGYSDWRMPTIEELASTITRSASNGLHINPIFAKKQKVCWSSDSGIVEDEYMKDVWIANFAKGRVVLYMIEDRQQLIGDYMETFYVKGVRSAR